MSRIQNKIRLRYIAVLFTLLLFLVACQPETVEVTRLVPQEVTRVVTETIEVAGEQVEVTRIVSEEVEVTRVSTAEEVEAEQEEEEVLVTITNLDPTSMDPHVVSDTQSYLFTLGLYETLVRWKPNSLELEPWLAEDFEISEDGLTYTFFLREDVLFHDGSEFNAEAAKFSFDRMKDLGKGRAFILDKVESVEAVDEFTLEITLSERDATFFQGLPNIWMVSPTAFGPHMGDDLAEGWAYDEASGTGPYEFVEWQNGIRVELEKFDDYWGGWDHPHVDRVIALVVDEPGTRRLMLERGDADVLFKLEDQIDDARALEENPDITVETFPTLSITYVVLANHKGPTADPLVRQAISYAFDYDAMLDIGFGGAAEQARGPLNSSIICFDEDLFQYERDLDRASELMAEAGYPDGGFDLTFGYVGSSGVQRRTAEILQASLADIGINVIPEPQVWPSLFDSFQDPETAPGMFNLNNHSAFPDPDFTFSRFFAVDAQGTGGFNGGYYTNETVDALIQEARVETDNDERCEMYEEIQELMVEDAPVIFNAEMVFMLGHQNYVKNIEYAPAFSRTLGYLNRIYIDKSE